MRRVTLAVAAAALLLLAVLAQWPARQLAALPAVHGAGLAAAEWSGTVWRGEARGLHWREFRLGRLTWRLRPLSLAVARPRAAIALDGPEVRGEALVRTNLGATQLAATDVAFSLPANWLQLILDQPFLQLGGRLAARLSTVRFVDGWLVEAVGTTRWEDARVGGRIDAALGGLAVVWETRGETIVGTVRDTGGPLGAAGTITLAERSYRLDLRLRAPEDAVALRQALAVLGRPDASGAVRLALRGPMVPIR